jgi:hypothetical protein
VLNGQVAVRARIDGRGPLLLLVDSGSSELLVLTPRAATGFPALDVKPSTVAGIGANTVALARRVRCERLELGTLQLTGRFPAAVLDGLPPGLDGIVGGTLFRETTTVLDYERRGMLFFGPNEFDYQGNGTVLPCQFDGGGMPVIEAEVDGLEGRFGLDTGDGGTLTFFAPFVEKHRLTQRYGPGKERTSYGFGGSVRTRVALVATLRLGSFELHDLPVELAVQSAGLFASDERAGNLGSHLLRRFTIAFDYAHHRIIFEKSATFGEPFAALP